MTTVPFFRSDGRFLPVLKADHGGLSAGANSLAAAVAAANIVGSPGDDQLTGSADDDAIFGLGGNDRLYGLGGEDLLSGGDGDDVLDGGRGADRMEGGRGDDAYYVENVGDLTIEAAGSGIDTVHSAVDRTLGDHLENLRLYGLGGEDLLSGGDGDDLLDGGRGADRMDGGIGNDTYFVENAGDRVVEGRTGRAGGTDTVFSGIDWVLGNNLENLTLRGSAVVGTGNGLANTLIGNGHDNDLAGSYGDDEIRGGGGDDTIAGGSLEVGTYRLQPRDDGADIIWGGSGSDTVVYAGEWSDEYYGSHPWFDGIKANLKTGIVSYVGLNYSKDRVYSVENIVSTYGNDNITGNDDSNIISVKGGINIVMGEGGNDIIFGGYGTYNYEIDNLDKRASELNIDRLYGGAGDDVIHSGGSVFQFYDDRWHEVFLGADKLSGGSGNDRLISGLGYSSLNGGSGADIFEVSNQRLPQTDGWGYFAGEITTCTTYIEDFDRSEGDTIYFWTIEEDFGGTFEQPPHLTPNFVGMTDTLDPNDLGYQHVRSDSGRIDTVLTYHYLCQTWGIGEVYEEEIDYYVVLKDFSGQLHDSDFVFL